MPLLQVTMQSQEVIYLIVTWSILVIASALRAFDAKPFVRVQAEVVFDVRVCAHSLD